MKNKKNIVIVGLLIIIAILVVVLFVGNSDNESGNQTSEQSTRQASSLKSEQLEMGSSYTVKDYAEFTPIRIETTTEISGPQNSYECYYAEDGKKYIDVVLDYKNLTEDELDINKLVSLKAKDPNGESYTARKYIVEDNDSIETDTTIKPQETVRLHCAVMVNDNEEELDLTLIVDDVKFKNKYNAKKAQGNIKEIQLNEKVVVDDYAELTINDVYYADKIEPSNVSDFYSYYKVDNENNTFLVLDITLKNLQGDSKDQDSFTNMTATYKNKYNYNGMLLSESMSDSSLDTFGSIDPLTEIKGYYAIEVPKDIISDAAKISIKLGKEKYIYTYNG